MLGRLFKQQSLSNLNIGQNQPQNTASSSSYFTSVEDTFSREELYGTTSNNELKPYQFNNKNFRILICQDGGNLRSKQTLFDSAHETISDPTSPNTPNHKLVKYNRTHHSLGELHDYIFGCGVPTKDTSCTTKVHILPVLSSLTNQERSIMITRLFLICDEGFFDSNEEVEWFPKPALPINIKAFTNVKAKVNIRLSISIIIPLESIEILHEVIINNWNEISYHLILLQKQVGKKIIGFLLENALYQQNRRFQLSNFLLQNEPDLNVQIIKLIKLVHYNSNIPKLINSRMLWDPSCQSKTNPMLVKWVLEILNWLELKDGKIFQSESTHSNLNNTGPHNDNYSSFLSSLLALIIPIRNSLISKPMMYNVNKNCKRINRVVIMTGNPVVAKKLIFIINGLIPNDFEMKNGINEITAQLDGVNLDIPESDGEEEESFGLKTPEYSPKSYVRMSPSNMNSARPIPIKKWSGSSTYSTSDNSLSKSTQSSKGWEIPYKSTASTATPTDSHIEASPRVIPIMAGSGSKRLSISKQSSMAYLSSSLNSVSSSSNYSLSKLGGSFIEKWKNPFNSSGTSYGLNSYMNFENNEFGFLQAPLLHTNIPRRSSKFSLRTPSPAIEHEEFTWGNIGSPNVSATPLKSRNPSLYDLYNKNLIDNNKSLNIKRTKNSMYYPIVDNTNSKDVEAHNKNIIKLKCSNILHSKVTFKTDPNKTLEVFVPEIDAKSSLLGKKMETAKSAEEKLIYKQRPVSSNVAYCEEFRPEFTLQSCKVNPKLESQVVNAMKNDLLFFHNNCDVELVVSNTIFINLRAREIKEIELSIDNSSKSLHEVPINYNMYTPESPMAEDYIRRNSQSVGSNSYKTTIRKVYTLSKNSGNKDLINSIDRTLDEINSLFLTNKLRPSLSDADFSDSLVKLVNGLLQ